MIKQKILSISIVALVGMIVTPVSAITLTFSDNLNPALFDLNPDTAGASNTSPLAAGAEFAMMDPNGIRGGGPPIDRDVFFGGETWSFNGAGLMTGVGGTPNNPGASQVPGSAAPNPGTNPTIAQNTTFKGPTFNWLAPTTSSLSGTAYGPAQLSLSGNATSGSLSVLFPVLETQWAEVWFPMGASQTGADTPGVSFDGNYSCTSVTCLFRMQAQETFNDIPFGDPGDGSLPDEDPGSAGFGNWTMQFDVVGSFDASAVVPVPTAVWLFGSGLLGLLGVARRRST